MGATGSRLGLTLSPKHCGARHGNAKRLARRERRRGSPIQNQTVSRYSGATTDTTHVQGILYHIFMPDKILLCDISRDTLDVLVALNIHLLEDSSSLLLLDGYTLASRR